MMEDQTEIGVWLEATLDQAYPFAFMLSFDDQEANALVVEAIELFFLRQDNFMDLDRFQVKLCFFQCLYRCFIAKKKGFWKPHEQNYKRSSLLTQLDSDVRAMIFCKQRLNLDFDDISFIVERDRHEVINNILVHRENLLVSLRAEQWEDQWV